MKLVVHELVTSLEQHLTVQDKIVQVVAVRPHLYRHNFPTGSLKVEIRDMADALVAESNTVAIADIGSEDFFHGYVRFDVSALLNKDTEYKFKLVHSGGYSFDEAAYCAWCNSFDLERYPKNFSPSSDFRYPMDVEIWQRRKV